MRSFTIPNRSAIEKAVKSIQPLVSAPGLSWSHHQEVSRNDFDDLVSSTRLSINLATLFHFSLSTFLSR